MKKKTRGRPKTLKRDEILDIIMKSYWAEGVRNISINEICRRTGVSKPGLYREFGNEDGLTKAALENYQKTVLIPMRSGLSENVTFEMAVEGLYQLYKEDKKRPKGCLFVKMYEVREVLGKETSKFISKLKKQSFDSYEQWAQALVKNGSLCSDINPEFAGRYIDAQFNNTFSLIAQGEKLEVAIKILRQSLSSLE